MKKHNGIISLWKFLFAIVIVFFHGKDFFPGSKNIFFYGGYIGVEFFFIVSGFYFCKSVLKRKYNPHTIGKDTLLFTWQKIKSFYLYVIIAYFFNLLLFPFFKNYKLSEIANSIWNLLLLKEAGFRTIRMCIQFWYLSAMIVSMFILYPLLIKYRENFICLVSPIIIFFGLGYLCHNWVGLDHSYITWTGHMYTGIIRALAEINIGCIIYLINKKLKNIEYSKLFKLILTIIGEASMLLVLFIINFINNPKNYDYIMLLMISISIAIFLSEKTYEYKILSVSFFYYLEKLSLLIFINHVTVIEIVNNMHPFTKLLPKNKPIVTIVITIIIAIIELKIFDLIKKHKPYIKIKKIFIKENNVILKNTVNE